MYNLQVLILYINIWFENKRSVTIYRSYLNMFRKSTL